MNVTVRIPDELAERLAAEGGDLERRALEAFAVAEYHAGRLLDPTSASSWTCRATTSTAF